MGSKPELISILLPIHHGEESLPQAIQSIQAQSYPHFEVLCCLDGPNDTSKTILKAFQQKDPRIHILELEEHQGVEAATNFALHAAKGKYIARLDHDDTMHPERLAKQLAFAQTQTSPFLLGTQIALIGSEPSAGQLHFIDWQNSLTEHFEMKTGLYKDSTLSQPSLFTERATLLELGGYTNQPWAEDLDLYFRAANSGVTFAKLAEVLTYKTLRPEQLTRTSPKCKRPALMKAKAHYLKQDPAYQQKAHLYILGTGPTAIQILEGLTLAGTPPVGFLEHKAELRKRSVQGYPVFPLQNLLEERSCANLILGAIGHKSTQGELKQKFQQLGLGPDEVLWMI